MNDELRPGAILRGKYRVERVIGMGGMGIVVLATHLRLGQRVAIKALHHPSGCSKTEGAKKKKTETTGSGGGNKQRGPSTIVRRFAREARAASRLRGEHAVRILDVDDSESGAPFLVMEHLEGQDLRRLLHAEGPLPVRRAVDYVIQACEAIAEAHAAGIIHRDLKPANLFLTTRPDGSALIKVLDFGISKMKRELLRLAPLSSCHDLGSSTGDHDEPAEQEYAHDHNDHEITQPDSSVGTPSYMSPEQITNARAIDVRADVWGLGVVLYQLLADALPFGSSGAGTIIGVTAHAPRPHPLREHRSDVPEELAAVVHRCIMRDRSDRYANVGELARALAPFGSSEQSVRADRVARTLIVAAANAGSVRGSTRARAAGRESSRSLASVTKLVRGSTQSLHDTPMVHTLGRSAKTPSAGDHESAPDRSDVRGDEDVVVDIADGLAREEDEDNRLYQSITQTLGSVVTSKGRERAWRAWVVMATQLKERLRGLPSSMRSTSRGGNGR